MIIGLSLGCGFIIWDLNFANSGSKEVMKDFLTQNAGYYHITHPEYYQAKNKKAFWGHKTRPFVNDKGQENDSILI
jgi:hypothetical protein